MYQSHLSNGVKRFIVGRLHNGGCQSDRDFYSRVVHLAPTLPVRRLSPCRRSARQARSIPDCRLYPVDPIVTQVLTVSRYDII